MSEDAYICTRVECMNILLITRRLYAYYVSYYTPLLTLPPHFTFSPSSTLYPYLTPSHILDLLARFQASTIFHDGLFNGDAHPGILFYTLTDCIMAYLISTYYIIPYIPILHILYCTIFFTLLYIILMHTV